MPKRAASSSEPKVKKPQTAFFLFMADFRPKFAKANPENKNVAVVGKAGGEAWKSLSEADKSVYVKKADAAKAKFAVDHPELVNAPKTKKAKSA